MEKQKSTVECMLAIVKACNRIKKNLEVNKSMIKAVSEMGDFEIVDMGFTNNCNGITKGNNEDLWIVLCSLLEMLRKSYNETKDKRYLYELIRLLPNSYKVVKL